MKFKTLLLFIAFIVFGSSALSAVHTEMVKAQLIYEDYFGDYFSGSTHEVEIDFQSSSPSSLYKLLRSLRRAESNLLLIAFGNEDLISNYFAGTKKLESNEVFAENKLFVDLKKSPEGKFYFRFVNPWYSKFADPNSPSHHWASPFKHLNEIGKKVVNF